MIQNSWHERIYRLLDIMNALMLYLNFLPPVLRHKCSLLRSFQSICEKNVDLFINDNFFLHICYNKKLIPVELLNTKLALSWPLSVESPFQNWLNACLSDLLTALLVAGSASAEQTSVYTLDGDDDPVANPPRALHCADGSSLGGIGIGIGTTSPFFVNTFEQVFFHWLGCAQPRHMTRSKPTILHARPSWSVTFSHPRCQHQRTILSPASSYALDLAS
ncbi:hypothetical protein PGT21_019882 [Puccinia graminis f. sp. tritici]|uniref:Uncharacterized protein n=1 Tax=Puccinia graminis f. sp. tritici TaxID=56615 RepID=A0A5B0PKG5_PUCGR|nr:hypothetical protein PGT21_019882 [Puccinia graminis f. sp. tritici]KAA1136545.1 hypothetical protein PGTUg99_035095 [Puccinia graminis f. sp. tritici]